MRGRCDVLSFVKHGAQGKDLQSKERASIMHYTYDGSLSTIKNGPNDIARHRVARMSPSVNASDDCEPYVRYKFGLGGTGYF